MTQLNHDKPYATVHGMANVRFEQDGRYFDVHEEEVSIDSQPDLNRKVRKTATASATEQPVAPDAGDKPTEGTDYKTLSWQALKKLVEEAGGVYTNKGAAIEYLTAADVATARAKAEADAEAVAIDNASKLTPPPLPSEGE